MRGFFFMPAQVVLLLLLTVSTHAQDQTGYRAFSQAELDQLLAPVALYPDTVLSQLLIAATYPLEVVMAERWTRNHPELEGEEALEAAESEDWNPSVKALVAFPELLQRMSENLEWTEQLGEAFLGDEERVLASIQDLRERAYDAGSLDDLEHLSVIREERHIVIEPVIREVVYIPYYDTRRVYGSWGWSDYPPYYWDHHHGDYHERRVYWGGGVHLSWQFFFSAFRWDHHHIVVIDRHYRDRDHFWGGRQIARHRHAHRWEHDPSHRRPRDYYRHRDESRRKREILVKDPLESSPPKRAWKDAHLDRWPALREGNPAWHSRQNGQRALNPGKGRESAGIVRGRAGRGGKSTAGRDHDDSRHQFERSRPAVKASRRTPKPQRESRSMKHSVEKRSHPRASRSITR